MDKRARLHDIIAIVMLIAVAIATIVYFRYGVQRADQGVDLWLLILWAALVVVGVDFLANRVRHREEIVRRFYLSEGGIYNYEIGYAPFSHEDVSDDALEFAMFAAVSLVEMSYGFEVVDPPEDFKPKFIVTTERLRFHRVGGEDDGAVVIDMWQGRLLHMVTPGDESQVETVGVYKSARELAYLLEENVGFTAQ